MAAILVMTGEENFTRLYLKTGVTYTGNATVDSTALDAEFDTPDLSNTILLAGMTDITIENNTNLDTWTQLDNLGEFNSPLPSTNSIQTNLVLQREQWLQATGTTPSLLTISRTKPQVAFRAYWSGDGATDEYVQGFGYVSGVADRKSVV